MDYPVPANEIERVAAVETYRVTDTPPDPPPSSVPVASLDS